MEDYKKVIDALKVYVGTLDSKWWNTTVNLISGKVFLSACREDENNRVYHLTESTYKIAGIEYVLLVSHFRLFDDMGYYPELLKEFFETKASIYPSIITPDRRIINYPYNDTKES